jgi:hypothetical protein
MRRGLSDVPDLSASDWQPEAECDYFCARLVRL